MDLIFSSSFDETNSIVNLMLWDVLPAKCVEIYLWNISCQKKDKVENYSGKMDSPNVSGIYQISWIAISSLFQKSGGTYFLSHRLRLNTKGNNIYLLGYQRTDFFRDFPRFFFLSPDLDLGKSNWIPKLSSFKSLLFRLIPTNPCGHTENKKKRNPLKTMPHIIEFYGRDTNWEIG